MPAPDRVGPTQTFSSVIVPNREIANYYNALEVDALLAGLSGGGGVPVDLSAYATTAYVDGELAKVYDKAAVDAAIAAAIAGLAAADLTGYATVSQVESLLADPANHPATDLSDYYDKAEVDAAIAAAGGVAVFEQDAEPAAGKDGDLWLSTAASVAAGATTDDGSRITMQDVDREIENALTDPSSAVLKELKDAIVATALSRINGYTFKTPDTEWQETTVAAGSGKVEASIRGGVLRLRGTVTLTTSKSTHIRTLPIGFPRPATGSATVCVAAESGVAERLVIVFINPDGKIDMSPMGNRVTDFRVDSATCQMP